MASTSAGLGIFTMQSDYKGEISCEAGKVYRFFLNPFALGNPILSQASTASAPATLSAQQIAQPAREVSQAAQEVSTALGGV